MLALRIACPSELTDRVLAVVGEDPAVSGFTLARGVSVRPEGDVITAEVAREGANALADRLRGLQLHKVGSVQLSAVPTWSSQAAWEVEQSTPGSASDAVVWVDTVQRAYDDSELSWSYLSFMTLATVLASIAIVLDSQILVIGAMVLGPEFGAVAALGVALVRRRPLLFGRAARTLILGFAVAIVVSTLLALGSRLLGQIDLGDVDGVRPGTAFIYEPGRWSLLIAMLAGAAGVLSITSARMGGMAGVFISVTTVPAAGNVALGVAFGLWAEVWGSTLQLAVNIVGMAVAGWLVLVLQSAVWGRVALPRGPLQRRFGPAPHD